MKRKYKNSINVSVLIVVVIGIIVLLNVLLTRYPYRKDITENKIYQLSESTVSILNQLDKSGKKVTAYFFEIKNGYLDEKTKSLVEGLLKEYDKKSQNLNVQVINLEKNPSLAQKYGLTEGYEVVFEMEDMTKVVRLMEMFKGTSFNGEQVYTSALKCVMNENPAVVYFLQGHKEAKLDSEIKYLVDELEREGYIIKTLSLTLENQIPEDASMIIDIGAKTEFSSKETEILKDYLDNGGKAIILPSAYSNEPQINELNKLLNNYNVNLNNDIVIDSYRNFYGAQNLVVPIYGANDIASKLDQQENYYMVIPDSRSIQIDGSDETINVEPLLYTTSDSYGETSLDQYLSNEIELEDVDNTGPLSIAAYISKNISEDKSMEIILTGSDIFVTNSLLDTTRSSANIEFIINSIKQLSPEKEAITINPKPIGLKQIVLPYNMQKLVFYSVVIITPVIVLLIGFGVWYRRKNL